MYIIICNYRLEKCFYVLCGYHVISITSRWFNIINSVKQDVYIIAVNRYKYRGIFHRYYDYNTLIIYCNV